MDRNQGPTARHKPALCLLVIGSDARLQEACRQCARRIFARLVVVSVAEMGARAAELRPLAIVVSELLQAFDPEEFRALARSVGAELIVIEPSWVQAPGFTAELFVRLDRCLARRAQSSRKRGA
jgi:hypothetical protein